MIRVEAVEIQNFGSFYGKHHVPLLKRGLIFVRGLNRDEPRATSNGAGKSTIFDSLDWALFGQVPKGDGADSIVNDEAGKSVKVTVRLQDTESGRTAIVTRKRKPNGLKFEIEGEEQTKMDAKATQVAIEQFLGLDRVLFHAAVYRSQDDAFNFCRATDGQRKDLLARLIPELETVDDVARKIPARMTEIAAELAAGDGKISMLRQERDRLQNAFDTAHERFTSWQQAQQARVQAEHAQAMSAHEQLDALGMPDIQALHAERRQVQDLPRQNERPHDVAPAREALQGWQAHAARAQGDVTRLSERIQQLLTLEGIPSCGQCGQPIQPEHVAGQKVQAEAEHAKAQQTLQDARQAVTQWQAELDRLEALNFEAARQAHQEQSKQAARIRWLTDEIQRGENLQIQIDRLNALRAQHEQRAEAIQAEVWPGQVEYDQATQKLADLDQRIAAEEQDLEGHRQQQRDLDFWKSATSLRGLKSVILDSKAQVLTDAANEWVQALTGGTTWIRFEPQSVKADGELTEKTKIRVFRFRPNGEIVERNFESWSGGEKTRVSLGIDYGLAHLLAQRASKPWSIWVADEILKGLDTAGRTALFELLEKLEVEKETLALIEHDGELQGQFHNELTIEYKEGRSALCQLSTEG